MNLQPHEQRVVAELDELRERLAKLDTFMGSRTFVNLEPEDRELLVLQSHLMTSLSFVLARRIKRFPSGVLGTRDGLHQAIASEVGAEFHTPHGDGVTASRGETFSPEGTDGLSNGQGGPR